MSIYNFKTKVQAYLAKIAGYDVADLPNPSTKTQELLKDIAEGYTALPEVKLADAGKVLAINSEGTGVSWVEQSAGGGALIITPTVTTEDDVTTETWDKTAREIMEAMPLVYVISSQTVEQGDYTYQPLDAFSYTQEGGFAAKAAYVDGSVGAQTLDDYPTVTTSDK